MHYYLYFPGKRGLTNAHLGACGLADLARDQAPVWFEPEGRGPDGGRGLACTWLVGDAHDPPLALLPSQDWQPCRPDRKAGLAKGAYWIGRDREKPVTPADVQRKSLYAGYWIELGDRRKWHCPTARFFPHRHGLGESGTYERSIDPAFAPFWEQTQAFAQGIFKTLAELNVLDAVQAAKAPKTLSADFDLDQTFAFAVQALAYNYRLNAELVTVLGLLDDEALRNVVKAAVDLPVLLDVRAQKKTAGQERVSIPVGAST